MEQTAAKPKQVKVKEGSSPANDGQLKPEERTLEAGMEEGAGEEEQGPEEVPLTESQVLAQHFEQLNEQLYKMEDEFLEDIEGKYTLDAIMNGIGRVATYYLP